MNLHVLAKTLIFSVLFQHVLAASTKALFLFKDVIKSNTTALQTSGFNTLIIFGLGLLDDGSIKYYSNTSGSSDVLVASNGSYVGGDALANQIRSFKNGTSITRVEISMNAQHVKDLMAIPGAGATTSLSQNFAALKTAWNLDAVNNDDESIYDVSSTVAFAKMLSKIGYKYTISPYQNAGFWAAIIKQLNTNSTESVLLDKVYLQCYDGGASNDPGAWQNTLGMKVVPLLWVTNDAKPTQGTTVAAARTKFMDWFQREAKSLDGGGYWNDYDIEKMGLSYKQYGDVLTNVFG